MGVMPDQTDLLRKLCPNNDTLCNKLRNGSTGEAQREENVNSKKCFDTSGNH
jgi:hypothetical protein